MPNLSKKFLSGVSALAFTVFLIPQVTFAQSDGGKIKGTVVDAAATEETTNSEDRATPDQGTFDEAERTLQRVGVKDAEPDEEAEGETKARSRMSGNEKAIVGDLKAVPDRKTQGEAED